MNFKDFSVELPKIKDLPLPGEMAHFKMAPEERIEELRRYRKKKINPRKAAVLGLFYPNEQNHVHILLILRKTYEGVHSNQIAFPGGKADAEDKNLQATALRETHEEVGVPASKISIVKALSKVYIPPSNFEVQPYIGLAYSPLKFVIQESEVESLIEVPLVNLMNDETIFYQNMSTSYAKNIQVPAFKFNGHTVWGATAMMLSELKEIVKQVL